jgi:hypothetical protein
MMETRTLHRFSQTARKWRDLVDRRCAHFVELHSSGRWKHYYDEAEFVVRMREALDLAETWSQIAPLLNEHTTPAPAETGPTQLRRKAA